MSTDALLQTIASSPRMSEIMAWPLDFDVTSQIDDNWFQVQPNVGKQAIAQDGTGGIFTLLGDDTGENRPVLYVSSEGQAGVIADTLAQALQLIIALPHWQDCIKFSGGGNLEQMQRVVPYSEREIREDEPEIDNLREELFNGLNLAKPVNPVEKLHRCLHDNSARFQVFSDDGSEFEGLFGNFVVESNPTWKPDVPAV